MPPKSKSRIRIKVIEFHCRYCGSTANNWDHAHPRSRGGSNVYWEPDFYDDPYNVEKNLVPNLFPCCAACNNDKGNMTHEEYLHLLSLRRALMASGSLRAQNRIRSELDRHVITCKVRAVTDKINSLSASLLKIKNKQASMERLTKDESMVVRMLRPKIDEMAESRLYLCVKALELGVSFGELARIMGKEAHKNRLRAQLKKRGYKP